VVRAVPSRFGWLPFTSIKSALHIKSEIVPVLLLLNTNAAYMTGTLPTLCAKARFNLDELYLTVCTVIFKSESAQQGPLHYLVC